MDAIHAEATERERRWKAEERLERASRQLDLTAKLVGVMEQLREAELALHELKTERLHRRHWGRLKRQRDARRAAEQLAGKLADDLRRVRKERDKFMPPPEVAILHPDHEQE